MRVDAGEQWREVLLVLLLVLVAGALYSPFASVPLEAVDFGEFVPLLREAGAGPAGFAAMLDYYGSRGRFNPVTFAYIVTQWSAFGLDPIGWQLTRFLTMSAVVAMAYVALRRLGRSALASALGCSLFVVARGAPESWMKVHIGEPLGTALMLLALQWAVAYQRALRWPIGAAAIAGMLTLAVLAKETMIAVIPFVVLVALLHQRGGAWALPAASRRNWGLVLLVGTVVTLGAVVPIAVTRGSATAGSYSTAYSLSAIDIPHAASVLRDVLLPGTTNMWSPMNVVFIGLVAAGIALRIWRHGSPDVSWLEIAAATSLPVAGALVYLPWPHFVAFYALPFLFGSAFLLSIAIDQLLRVRSSSLRWGVTAALVVFLAFGLKWVHWTGRRITASRHAMAEAVQRLANARPDLIVTLAPEPDGWNAHLLSSYGRATGRRLAAVIERSCDQAGRVFDEAHGFVLLVHHGGDCRLLDGDARWPVHFRIERPYSYLDGRFRRVRGAAVIEVRSATGRERLLHSRLSGRP